MVENYTAYYDLMISLVRLPRSGNHRGGGFTQMAHICLFHPLIANLVLEDTVERIHHGDAFAENWHGLFLIRGENVVLLGEIVR